MPTTSLRGRKLQRKYKAKQAIYLATKKDLLRLCKSRVIPVEYHDFYKGLPANAKVNDTPQVPMQRRMNKILTRSKCPQISDRHYRHFNSSDTLIKKKDVLDF